MILRLTSGEQTTKFPAHSAIFEWWKMLVSQNSKLKTQFSCFKTCLVWVSSVFPVLSCHASLLSVVWWSKLAVRETYISRSMNQVSWMGSQKIFLGRSLVKITPSTKWILCHTIYITQGSISSFLSCDRHINLNAIFFYNSIYRFY